MSKKVYDPTKYSMPGSEVVLPKELYKAIFGRKNIIKDSDTKEFERSRSASPIFGRKMRRTSSLSLEKREMISESTMSESLTPEEIVPAKIHKKELTPKEIFIKKKEEMIKKKTVEENRIIQEENRIIQEENRIIQEETKVIKNISVSELNLLFDLFSIQDDDVEINLEITINNKKEKITFKYTFDTLAMFGSLFKYLILNEASVGYYLVKTKKRISSISLLNYCVKILQKMEKQQKKLDAIIAIDKQFRAIISQTDRKDLKSYF